MIPKIACPTRWSGASGGGFFIRSELEKLVRAEFGSPPSAADKGGRPQEHNWDAVKSYALAMIRKNGFPGRGNRKFPSKTQLVEDILNNGPFKA